MQQGFRTVARVAGLLLLLGIASWIAGLIVYAVALRLFFGELASGGDWDAVLFWSGPLFTIFLLCLVWPVMLRLTTDYSDGRRFIVLPAAGIACGVVPTVVLAMIWNARYVFSAEALLFAGLFCAASGIFGFGYALLMPWIHR